LNKDISIIVGTRPQIIKSQPIIHQLKKSKCEINVINTGQHYDYLLSKKFFHELDIEKPSVNLGIGSGTQIQQISEIIVKLEKYLKKTQPKLVIVPGDTTSALASAIAVSKCGIKLAHLEAGARSNQFYMAEEVNRRMIDHCSNLLFAPTKNCLQNLKLESIYGNSFFVGDTMYDLFLKFNKKYEFHSIKKSRNHKQILLTIHRAENIRIKENLKKISILVNKLNKNGFQIIFPIHPHTKKKLKEFNLEINCEKIEPIGYIDLMKLMARSALVITDSGGLQKETYWMGNPCITIRESTEWVETIKEKANFLMSLKKPFSIEKILKISKLKIKPKSYLYGSGKASDKITSIIKKL